MLRSLILSGSALLAAADVNTFTPTFNVYTDSTCNTVQSSVVGTSCAALKTAAGNTIYVKSGACNFDNEVVGLQVCTTSTCAVCTPATFDAPISASFFGNCTLMNNVPVAYFCDSDACCSSTGAVVSLAVILAFAGVGLCVFWVYSDIKFKAKAKLEAADLEKSIADEKAKASAVGGVAFGAPAGTGYVAMGH